MNIIKFGFAVLVLVATGRASAETRTFDVPSHEGKATPLKMRVVGYKGGTNGAITVEVLNPGKASSQFAAQGLYFVPETDTNDAPQRLGAVGPLRIRSDGKWRTDQSVAVPPAGAVTLELDVYCIDSHRRSPKTGDRFRLAQTRMPRELAREIHEESSKAAGAMGGFAAPAAKSAVQSQVWKARDKKWLKLEGEGRQEAGK
jgi:hypothetical protein